MKIGNWLFIKMNNESTSHQSGKQFTVLSLELLAALGATTTVAQADTATNNLTSENTAEYTQYNSGFVNNSIQVPVQPVVNNPYNYNLRSINQRSNKLYQQILMHHNAQLTRSFNANQILNQQKAAHQALVPYRLELPASSAVNQVKPRRALFLIKLQIIITLYILFRNFVPLLKEKDKRENKSNSSGVTSQIHKTKILHNTVTFRDAYGNQDGLTVPKPITRSGASNDMYIVIAPDNWALVKPNGKITNKIKFNYRDGNQTLNVVPVYKGLIYKYNLTTKTLEFTHGTLNDVNDQPFLDNENTPKGIPISKITSIKFATSTQTKGLNLRSVFIHEPYLRLINVKGSVIKRKPSTKNVKRNRHRPDDHVQQQAKSLLSNHSTSRQAETNALNELSMIIGGLDDNQHRQNN